MMLLRGFAAECALGAYEQRFVAGTDHRIGQERGDELKRRRGPRNMLAERTPELGRT